MRRRSIIPMPVSLARGATPFAYAGLFKARFPNQRSKRKRKYQNLMLFGTEVSQFRKIDTKTQHGSCCDFVLHIRFTNIWDEKESIYLI
jgi:hypothetical protein